MTNQKSLFIETFGESPFIKVLDFFLTYPRFDYSKTQVADEIRISRITIEKIWKELIKKVMIYKVIEPVKLLQLIENWESEQAKTVKEYKSLTIHWSQTSGITVI
jgi:hypothetical protein